MFCLCVQEKEDKAMLQEEVQHLRQDNMRLQEESQTAAAQLRKFTEWFFHTIDKKPWAEDVQKKRKMEQKKASSLLDTH